APLRGAGGGPAWLPSTAPVPKGRKTPFSLDLKPTLSCMMKTTYFGRKQHGKVQSLLYQPAGQLQLQPTAKAAQAAAGRRHGPDRLYEQVRRHQDPLRRAGEPGLPAAQLRQGGGRPGKRAG